MLTRIFVGLIVFAGALVLLAFLIRQHFAAELDGLEARVRASAPASAARIDLPGPVLDLAARLGARQGGLATYVTFDQGGQMWRTPGAAPTAFRARQTVASTAVGFVWRASFAPLGMVLVADYFVGEQGGLDARLFGVLHVAGETATAAVNQGEALRYLAEIPWNPDIILANAALHWTVVDERTIAVATMSGDRRAEVTFTLDERGFIATASAPARMREEDGKWVARPWLGRFADYAEIAGRQLPTRGEVAWIVADNEFVYWRGTIHNWHAH